MTTAAHPRAIPRPLRTPKRSLAARRTHGSDSCVRCAPPVLAVLVVCMGVAVGPGILPWPSVPSPVARTVMVDAAGLRPPTAAVTSGRLVDVPNVASKLKLGSRIEVEHRYKAVATTRVVQTAQRVKGGGRNRCYVTSDTTEGAYQDAAKALGQPQQQNTQKGTIAARRRATKPRPWKQCVRRWS